VIISGSGIVQHAAEYVVKKVAQDLLLFESVGLARGEHVGPLAQDGTVRFQRPWQLKPLQMGPQGIRTEKRFSFNRHDIFPLANGSGDRAIMAHFSRPKPILTA